MSERSRVLSVLECLLWVALGVIALGAALLISLLVDIDCNGLWGDRPDDGCMNRRSWTAVLPLAVLAGLAAIRVKIHQRSRPTGRRGVLAEDR